MIRLETTRGRTPARALLEGRRPEETHRKVNVSEPERALSLVAGSVLTAVGLRRMSMPGLLLAGVGGMLAYRGATGTCQFYKTVGIDTAREQTGVRVHESFTINRPPDTLYHFWRDFENLPRIMRHLKSVKVLDESRSHWVTTAPAFMGGQLEWDAELIEDVPNEELAWRSLPGSQVDSSGKVRFEETPRGTAVHVELSYVPLGGKLGAWVATLAGQHPERQIHEDLRDFKRMMEIGELPTTEGQPRGDCAGAWIPG